MNEFEQFRADILALLNGIALAEREACAKAVEEWGKRNLRMASAQQAAAAIRARPPFQLPPIAFDFIKQHRR